MDLQIPILPLSLLLNIDYIIISIFLLVAPVADSDWLTGEDVSDDALNLYPKIHILPWIVQLDRPGLDLVSHEARTVCHSSASGYATHKMDIRTGHDWID